MRINKHRYNGIYLEIIFLIKMYRKINEPLRTLIQYKINTTQSYSQSDNLDHTTHLRTMIQFNRQTKQFYSQSDNHDHTQMTTHITRQNYKSRNVYCVVNIHYHPEPVSSTVMMKINLLLSVKI